jgi:predicted phage terminase large subunit-like protein
MPGGGHYIAAGVGGGITGEGATIGIIDDPVKNAEEAYSTTYREKTWEWYATTFSTRFERGAVEIICQTRWHEDDLAGRIIDKSGEGIEIIRFPALADEKEEFRDVGEAIWPDFYPREQLLERLEKNGSRAFNALYQQRPAPDEGSIIKRHWFQYYNPREYKITGKRVNFYVDTAYTDREKNDPTAMIAYIKEGPNFYVLDCISEWLDFSSQLRRLKEFVAKNGYSPSSIIRVEPKATGITLAQVVKKETALNIREAEPPRGDKVARAHSCEGPLEGGRVFLPEGMTWVDQFLTECAAFPNAAHDDRVDCLTGMIISELNARPAVSFA